MATASPRSGSMNGKADTRSVSRSHTTERAIMAMAASQHGIVSRRQLARAGISLDVIDRYVSIGRLRRIYRGTFQVGPVTAPRARVMAAVLACGENTVASHRSAAALWGIMHDSDAAVDVTVAGRSRSRAGLRAHRAMLNDHEVTSTDGVPVTTPTRTLYDLAGIVGSADDGRERPGQITHRDLERAMAEALAERLTTVAALRKLLAGHHGRGAGVLRELLDAEIAPALTRSEAEERFLGLTRRAQLDHPAVNAIVEGFEVDFLWRAQRLIVEVDGHRYHASKRSFESDRLRDAKLLAAGYSVMRVTWDQIMSAPEALLVRLVWAMSRAARPDAHAALAVRSSERRT